MEEHTMNRMKKIVSVPRLGVLALAAFALTARTGRADPAAPPASADDARIVQRVLSLNRTEVRTADEVKGKLSSLPAWQLAQRMTVDHAALDRKFGDLASSGQPATGTVDGGTAAGDLAKLSGRDLDKAYVGHEVKSHEEMLATLDRELIPNAKSEELQRRLIELRSEVAAHLQSARGVQNAQRMVTTYEQQRADISKEIGNSGP